MAQFIVRLGGPYAVELVESFDHIPSVVYTGQQYKLSGAALVDVSNVCGQLSINLCHPDTTEDNGHKDVIVHLTTGKISFHRYSWLVPIDFRDPNEVRQYWPTGLLDLLNVVNSIEKYLSKVSGILPLLPDILAQRFNPLKVSVAA